MCAGLHDLGDLVGDSLHAHLWLLVVCGDLGRGDHVSLLAAELLLDTTIKEECDMRILFRLWRQELVGMKRYTEKGGRTSDVCLLNVLFGEPLCENVGHGLRWECNREGEGGIVPRHSGDMLFNPMRNCHLTHL